MIRGKLITFLVAGILAMTCHIGEAQKVALKTNAAYWAIAGTPNLGLEFSLGKKTTFDIVGGYNPWDFGQNRKNRVWIVQPELRFWPCEVFNGHFFGLHAQGGQFNAGGWNIPVGRIAAFKENILDGKYYGGGLSYGYQAVLSPRWNLEFEIGGGYNRLDYSATPISSKTNKAIELQKDYWGITKVSLSLVYLLK